MNYIEIKVDITAKPAFSNDIVVAFLAEIGCESFTEENRIVSGFIQKELFSEQEYQNLLAQIAETIGECETSFKELEQKNWNVEWESQFEPVVVGEDCIVRAPFHEKPQNIKYDIVIEPKMSFGTGHHETTFLMLQQMLQEDLVGKKSADCGCGTGVLGIMAEKLGANSVYAFDYDEWCYINTKENVEVNNCTKQTVEQGDMSLLKDKKFDFVLANINRNILTGNMSLISQSMNENSRVLMSGFYEKDIPIVEKQALENGLKLVSYNTKNNWAVCVFLK